MPSNPLKTSVTFMNSRYSDQVISNLPIQNGSTVTSNCGPSAAFRPFSDSGLPIVNLPPAIGAISNSTSVPGIVAV